MCITQAYTRCFATTHWLLPFSEPSTTLHGKACTYVLSPVWVYYEYGYVYVHRYTMCMGMYVGVEWVKVQKGVAQIQSCKFTDTGVLVKQAY